MRGDGIWRPLPCRAWPVNSTTSAFALRRSPRNSLTWRSFVYGESIDAGGQEIPVDENG